MKNLLTFCILVYFQFGFAFNIENDSIPTPEQLKQEQIMLDSINNSFTFDTGIIDLDGLATVKVPKGFKYLDAEQSKMVLTDLWGNPPSECLGMLFPADQEVVDENFTFAIEINYSEEGHIKDDDVEDIDYDELLEQMQEDAKAENANRTALGYQAVELVGWASAPFYDKEHKKLHWAKELSFEGEEENTLNYNIRVLGRRGYLNLNVISYMENLSSVQQNIDPIIESVTFNQGNRYGDFNPDIDEVAAYGIGGLIAGKVLAKAGVFAGLLKFWKFIAIGAIGLFGVLRKTLFGGNSVNNS